MRITRGRKPDSNLTFAASTFGTCRTTWDLHDAPPPTARITRDSPISSIVNSQDIEENETFRQSTAIERNYFYQKMDRSIYKRRPRAVISKSAWSQNKRRKKKGKKTGDNKNGATMERRDPRILPSPPAEIHHFKIRENTPLSNRPADKGSKGFWTFVRVPRSDVETRASICVRADTRPLQWTRNAWKRAWLRDTFVYRYRCLGFAAARMEVHSITDLP